MSTGFGLSDLTAEGTTPLKDMLNAKVELNVSWHVKMAEVASRMTIRLVEFRKGQACQESISFESECHRHKVNGWMKVARAMLGGW